MPYRRLPNTDKSRLAALKTLLDNNDIYTARDRFLEWKDINEARTCHDRLLTAVKQYEVDKMAQWRSGAKIDALQRKAYIYVSHFMQVLLMAVARGEIKRANLKLYGTGEDSTVIPVENTLGSIFEWAPKIIAGEKARIKKGGRPIYNPTIGMVETHFDIFREAYDRQKQLQQRTADMEQRLKELRPETDALILRIWDQIEAHFGGEGKLVIDRVADCERFGVRYYMRRKEKRQQKEKEKPQQQTTDKNDTTDD